MSVLLQRPHHVPGLITLNRQQPKHASSVSPARQRQHQRSTQPALDRSPVAGPILSPKLNRKPNHKQSVSISAVPQPPSDESPSKPRRRQKSAQATPASSPATPRKGQTSNTAPATPVPAAATPVRRRSPKPSPRIPAFNAAVQQSAIDIDEGLPEWDSPARSPVTSAPSTPVPANNRIRRSGAPNHVPMPDAETSPIPPVNWQQVSLFGSDSSPTTHGAPTGRSAPLTGSHSTPSSPVAQKMAPSTRAPLARSSTVPPSAGLGFPPSVLNNKRTPTHTRAPSYPTFPMHRQKDTFTSHGGQSALEALFNLNLNGMPSAIPINGHVRGASSTSLGSAGIHARMAERERERQEREQQRRDDFAAFAGASFQAAPNAISARLPSIFGRLTSVEGVAPMAEEDVDDMTTFGAIDLGDTDHQASNNVFPAFLM